MYSSGGWEGGGGAIGPARSGRGSGQGGSHVHKQMVIVCVCRGVLGGGRAYQLMGARFGARRLPAGGWGGYINN